MNRYVQLTAVCAAVMLMQTACAGGRAVTACNTTSDFSAVRDKDWKLMEVRAGKDVIFERGMLKQEVPEDVFTLRFDSERASGAGCPNRYFSPYALAEKQAISIQPIASTLMLALFEPEQLKERDFFSYLEKADQWNLVNGNLELRSKNNESAAVVLVFSLTD
jgi:heat shock protein HslJ